MTGRLKLGAQGAAVLAVAALLGLLVWKLTHQPHVPTGVAPNFSLPRLDGKGTVELASLRGKVVVVNFWASWCEPCKQEAKDLQAAADRWGKRGVVVVGVDSQDFTGDARRFARRYGMTYPLVHDGPAKTRDAYGVTGFPETYFIDRTGRLVAVVLGNGKQASHFAGPVTAADLDRNIKRALET